MACGFNRDQTTTANTRTQRLGRRMTHAETAQHSRVGPDADQQQRQRASRQQIGREHTGGDPGNSGDDEQRRTYTGKLRVSGETNSPAELNRRGERASGASV